MLGFSWDVTGDQSPMFSSDQYKVGFNLMKYSNPQVDELNRQSKRELDPEKRVELLIESANLVNDDLPIGVISFRKDRIAYATRIKNYNPNDIGGAVWLWPLPYVYVEEE
jgi:ABC-type transport system substrate-binding protein